MARDDWYRKTTWSPADQQDFIARLKRSRPANRAEYLRIQAACLANARLHAEARELLDLHFRDYPDCIDRAQAHLQKAECLVALNQGDAAIAEFRATLQREREFPNVRTNCWLEFPWFIVVQKRKDLYDEASALLDEFEDQTWLTFPAAKYRYATVRALIAEARGDPAAARRFAAEALASAAARHSGYRYHPDVGLVNQIDSTVYDRLVALAGSFS